MNDSEAFNILRDIRKILRRDIQRVIDIEWARMNRGYAREIVYLCGLSSHPDLPQLASRLVTLLQLNDSMPAPAASWPTLAPIHIALDAHTDAAANEAQGHSPRYRSVAR